MSALVLLFWLASLACGGLTPVISATQAPASPTPPGAQFAGRYGCAGHEFGLIAAAGDLSLAADGTATFRDYYGHEQTGTWSLGAQANSLVFQGMDLLTGTYDPANKRLLVSLKPESQITHTADHFMDCSLSSPPGTVTQTLPPISPTPVPAAYTGQFDCYGTEGGLGAYAGRITVQPGGAVTFKDYDNSVQAGAWTYDASGSAFTFTGGIALASAVYDLASDSLVVVLRPDAHVVHAEAGGMKCQRAKPGITGPP